MAKQLNVSLGFQADTSQARAQIQSLINDLNKIGSVGNTNLGKDFLTSDILEAKMAAKELGVTLNDAFDVETGKLDLNKFNTSLKQSGMSLTEYGNKLAMLGPTGDQAFLQVAQSIIETEAPLRRSGKLLREFGTTLANTARWQISSSILHGFMGAIQDAYGYAQDLDESLNNIRIVTGQNADQMAEFAQRANKAAKALSSTTVEYTDASLIYYQQGLDDKEVEERANITVKMANVVGQSTQVISDQMTAVWNNFDDGTKSLEYYADVMTALGAKTASSTDEIAGGLEKFAAIGETIGLSYEYAASALATITSNTRQSEEVVGTALKTIFARIQGLKLGETLEDGVSLNKYSEALQKVGISIFDQTGELKAMDDILDEMGAKWDTLSKAQQTALAQTVAGVRQYTQLVALMENWNNGDNDSMMANLDTSYNSSGALQEQADIYAESWEASQDRVQSALEGVYDSVLDKDFFISLNDGFASMLGAVETFVDAIGGMPGILALVGVIGTRVFGEQIATGINNAMHSLKNFTGVSLLEMKALKKEAYDYAMAMTRGTADDPGVAAQREHLKTIYNLQIQTEEALQGANAEQEKAIKKAYELAKSWSEAQVEAAKYQATVEEENGNTQREESAKYGRGAAKKVEDSIDVAPGLAGADLIKEARSVESAAIDMGASDKRINVLSGAIQNYRRVLKETPNDQDAVTRASNQLIAAMERVGKGTDFAGEAFAVFQEKVGPIAQEMVELEGEFTDLQDSFMTTAPTEQQAEQLQQLCQKMQEAGLPVDDFVQALQEYNLAIGKDSSTEGKARALDSLGKSFSKCKISAEDMNKVIKKRTIDTIKDNKETNKYTNTLNKQGKKLDGVTKSAKKTATAQRNSTKAAEEARKKVDQYAESLERAKKSINGIGSGAAKMTQGLSSMGMALSSIQGLWGTLTDPDTSGFEKFIAILSSSGMVVGSFSSGLSSLKEGLNLIKTATDGTTAAMLKQAMQMKTSELQENSWLAKIKEKIAARKAEEVAAKASMATEQQEAAITMVSAEASEEKAEEDAKGALANVADAAASGGDTVAKGAEAVATTGAGVAQTFLNTTLLPFIALMGAALVAVLPYIAAMGVLVAVVGAVAYAMTEESRALEEATAREERAAKMSEHLSSEVEKVNTSLDNIESKSEAFKELEAGTSEWYQTLTEVNAEIRSLIELYPELLSMGAITMDSNGLMGITDAGIDYINQQNAKQQATATNIQLRAQQNTLEVETDNAWDDFRSQDNGVLMEESAQALVASYQAYGDAMFENAEVARQVRSNMEDFSGYDFTNYYETDTDEELLEFINNNRDRIIEQANRIEQSNAIDDQILMNKMQPYGSIRNLEQTQDLMEGYEDYSVSGEGNSKALTYTKNGQEKSFNMNKSINYTDDNMPQEIKDFMALQGEDVEYVAQRNGKLVLEVDGEEVEFSEDEVYDALGELYSGEEFEEQLRTNLENSLSSVIEEADLTGLSMDELVGLDNIHVGLVNAFENDTAAADAAFQRIVGAYGTSKEQLQQLTQDTQYIDTTSAAFQRLAENANLSGEALQKAIQEMNALGQIDSMGAFFSEQAEAMGLDAEAAGDMQDYAKHLMEVSGELEGVSDSLATDAESAADLAVEITRMNKGIDTLADNFDDWNDILKNSSKGSMEYSKALSGMKSALGDILDVNSDLISSDFVTDPEHLEDIEKAAAGDAEAIDRLRAAMDEEIITNISMGQTEEFKQQLADLDQALKDTVPEDVEVGVVLTGANQAEQEFLDAANNIVQNANMTADEANAYFAGIGYEPVYNVEDIDTGTESPNVETLSHVTGIGFDSSKTMTADLGILGKHEIPAPYMKTETVSTELPPTPAEGTTRLMSFSGSGKAPPISGMRKKATGSQNNYSSSNKGGKSPGSGSGGGGGGGSKPKKADKVKKSDIVERYKEINDQLKETSKLMSKNGAEAEGLWGAARFKKMREGVNLIKQENAQLQERIDLAKQYKIEDQKAVKAAAKAAGVSLNFDKNGYITNYTEEMTKLYKEMDAAVNNANADGDVSDAEQEKIDKIQEKIDNLKDAISQYEETLDQIADDEQKKLENQNKIWEENFNILNEELELKININEQDLAILDYYLSKIENDLYSAAEAMGYMGQQSQLYGANLLDQKTYYNDLIDQYKKGEISMAQLKEGMENIQAATIENLQSLQESKIAMQDYYGNVIAMAQEELAAYTDQMEHLNSVMDHYTSIMDILGKQKDFGTRRQILEGKAQNVQNQIDVYKEEYQIYSAQAEEWKTKMLSATVGTNEYETYKKNWEAAQQAANEAQENMLSKTEEWAEAMKAIVENNLNELADTLEKSLTGGADFDTLLNSMQRASSIQEEYLTTTNKIYETNKLMRTAQQEIDKTSNEVAKRKMKDFIEETKQLQNRGKLSQYELKIQQAKYDLLVAEIALKEAQNAKSTVRLQRDSEGNFGYVYTADSSKTAEAEQKFADAQNSLYNIGLEGANDYNQKYADTMSEMYNELTELQQKYLEGAFDSEEEYQEAMEATKKYYYEKLEQYSSLYKVAVTTDSRVIADAWSTDFSKMMSKTEEWKSAVNTYASSAASELTVWASTIATVMSSTNLDAVDSELKKMATDSTALKDALIGDDGLISAVQKETEEVGKLSEAYIAVQNSIDAVISSYEKFLGTVNAGFSSTGTPSKITITFPTIGDLPVSFDTGGYTGDWGTSGKIAFLHEKELILNQQDTQNLMQSMSLLDNIVKTIDLQATNAALGGLLNSPSLGGMNSHDILEQNVKIEASFPNASNRLEIEEAFTTLVNRASQYANRK